MNKLEKEKQELEQRLKQINQELEKPKNGWYNNGVGYLLYYDFDSDNCYGFYDEVWIEGTEATSMFTKSMDKTATHEEVEKAFIKEAEKRGYKEGAKTSCLRSCTQGIIDDNIKHSIFVQEFNTLEISFSGRVNGIIFKEGKWAEIIEEPKVIINGYEMKQEGNKIIFGCMSFTTSRVQSLYKHCEVLGISSVSIDENQCTHIISLNQLKQIVDNIK